MNKIYVIVIAILISVTTLAQPTFNWAKGMGGSNQDFGLAVAVDGSGNVYSTGYFQGTVDFDPGGGTYNLTSLGVSDVFISKLDANGNFVWAKQIGGTYCCDEAKSIAVDISGNVYVTGTFGSTVDFDPNAGVFNMSAASGDAFILKLSGAGNFVFARELGNGVNPVYPQSIVVDGLGNIYTTGMFWSTADFDPGAGTVNMTPAGGLNDYDVYVSKLNSSGNFVWAKQLGGTTQDYGYGITVDGSYNVYTVGYFNTTADFDPGAGTFNMTAAGSLDGFVSKLDASGNFVWAKQFAGTNSEYGNGITNDAANNIYITGVFFSTTDFDPSAGTFNLTSVGASDAFITKLDASGNFVFAKQIGGTLGEVGNKICLDSYGNIYTIGNFSSPSTDFDPGTGTFTLATNGSNDAFISKLDGAGNFLWAGNMGGTSNENGNSIVVDALANIYTAGVFSSTLADFDASPNTYTLSTVNQQDIFVTKYCQIPVISSGINGLNSICAGAGANNYSISAASGASSYTWSLPGGWIGSSSTNIISATPGSSGVFTVTASNSCGMSAQQTLSVTVNSPPPTPGAINGPVNVCIAGGPAANYSVAPVAGSTSYTWTLPGSWTGSSATNTINATPGLSGIFTITASNSCGMSAQQTLSITVHSLPTLTISSSGGYTICSGTTVTLTVSGANSYTWQSGPTGPTIVATPTISTGYQVAGTTTVGCMSTYLQNINVNPLPNVNAITSNTLICGPPFQQTATLTANGANTYTWNPGGAGTSISISPSITTVYTVTGTDANGCMNSFVMTQSVSACASVGELHVQSPELKAFPNPTSGKFTLEISAIGTAEIYNTLGEKIYSVKITEEKLEIDLTGFSAGLYIIKQDALTKKIIKN